MKQIVQALVSVTKVDPKAALKVVLAAIGVLTVATELLKEVAKSLAGL